MALPNQAGTREDLGSDSEPEDKELTLNEYDRIRKKVPIVHNRSIVMNTKILSTELTCPICLDLLTATMTTKECLHRFCSECISMALLRGNKECPTCRTKLVSKRSLRHDTNFDALIKQICPDRHKYDEMLMVANQDGDDALSSIVAYADDQDRYQPDLYDPFDKDAPTPPALLDSRRTSSPLELYDESGRRTPPWFTVGKPNPIKMTAYEKKLFMQAQKAYLMLKKRRLGRRIAAFDRIFNCERRTKAARETASPSAEPHAKSRKLESGRTKKPLLEENKSCGSSADSAESDSDDGVGAAVEAELDNGDMEELDMMDGGMFLVNTSRAVKGKAKKGKGVRADSIREDGPSSSNIRAFDGPSNRQEDPLSFDPRFNPEPPYPEAPEFFAELMPNGKGGTWQPVVENNPTEQPPEEDPDEEMVFDEEDVLSIVSIDDLLHEMGEAPHERDAEANYAAQKPEGVFPDLNREMFEEKDKYMCDETRMHLREINELRSGGLSDIKAMLEGNEQFDLGEATTWYSQTRNGEEMVYYEKSKQPLSRGRHRVTKQYDVAEEVERIGRRVTLKDIKDDMSDTDSDHETPCTMSLASSPPSSKLTLSEINEDEGKEESPAIDLPLNSILTTDRVSQWIGEMTPTTPEQLDTPLDRSTMDEEEDDDCESLPDNYEIEAELRPSAALLTRNVPADVLQTRYIRTQHNTTVEHIGEFLYQRWLGEVHSKAAPDEAAPEVPRPEHFYVYNRQDRSCKYIFVHETLSTAHTLTTRDDHVVIYFDTQRAEISSSEMSLLDKIVPLKDRPEPTPTSSRESTGSSSSH